LRNGTTFRGVTKTKRKRGYGTTSKPMDRGKVIVDQRRTPKEKSRG